MASVAVSQATPARFKQNWIVDPWSDVVFIIAAPILAFIWALITLRIFGATIVWNIFIIFNIAHHFPTFIRIYGDKDLFKRFRWSLLLGPIIPFSAGLFLSYYVISNGYPLSTMFFVLMVLTLWDPWHFLMQHYGFMRIYDRHNASPPKLAAWMDYSISVSWFAFIMLATTEWFIEGILYALFNDSGLPVLMWIDPDIYRAVIGIAFSVAVMTSLIYTGYLVWCWRKGFYISPAKLCLLCTTFVMMYFTYVPNSFLRTNYPDWQFGVGFATLGMVHVTQYLAIVWKYNRGLAQRGAERSRSGFFTNVFSRGGMVVACMYVAVCLIYGALFSSDTPVVSRLEAVGLPQQVLTALSCLIVTISFTSTFMHYYYDGFIWKLRHKENRENLAENASVAAKQSKSSRKKSKLPGPTEDSGTSWWERMSNNTLWERFRGQSFSATLVRQLCYFGIPISLLVIGFLYLGQMPLSTQHRAPTLQGVMEATQQFSSEPSHSSLAALQMVLRKVDRQIAAEEKMTQLNPVRQAAHEKSLAMLLYARAGGKLSIALGQDQLAGTTRQPTASELADYRSDVTAAISIMERQLPPGTPIFSEEQQEIQNYLEEWKNDLQQL